MNKLSFTKLKTEEEVDLNFTCGIGYIDEYIRSCYYPFVCKHENIYLCKINSEIVGYAAISIKEIDTNKIDLMTEYYADSKSFGIVYLNYIAIRESKQKLGFGTYFLAMLIRLVKEYSKILPLRFIIIEALKEKIDWYQKRGFKMLECNGENDNPYMFLELMNEEEFKMINDYFERSI